MNHVIPRIWTPSVDGMNIGFIIASSTDLSSCQMLIQLLQFLCCHLLVVVIEDLSRREQMFLLLKL